jgi:hypothetical protein
MKTARTQGTMRIESRTVLLLLAVCVCGPPLSAQKVSTYKGSAADFKSYKTYSWLPGRALTSQGIIDNPPATPVVQQAVDEQLAMRGLRKVDTDGDLQVTFGIARRLSFRVETAGGWYVLGYTSSIYVPSFSRTNTDGTLALNLIDARQKKSAFLAICTATAVDSPSVMENKVRKAVEKAFKKYPVPKLAK